MHTLTRRMVVATMICMGAFVVGTGPTRVQGVVSSVAGQAATSAFVLESLLQRMRALRIPATEAPAAPAPPAVAAPLGPRNLEELRVPILVYHHVREQEGWSKETWSWKMTVSPDVFDRQMQWLADRGYTTIDLDTLAAILEGTEYGPEKPVVLTFDDNNINVLENGLEAMTSRGLIGVFYLVANRIDQPGVVGRAHLPALLAHGMSIQSHTMTHAGLTNLSDADILWQISESKKLLEEATGKPVRHLAYPLTMHNQRVRDLTKTAGYSTATVMDPRPMRGTDDRMKLPRIMMTDETDLQTVLP